MVRIVNKKASILIIICVLLNLCSPFSLAMELDRVQEDIMLIPVRKSFESMGFSVKWNESDCSVLLEKDKIKVFLYKDESYIRYNDREVEIKYPMVILNGNSFCSSEIFDIMGYDYKVVIDKINDKLNSTVVVGEKSPQFILKDINGEDTSLVDFRGKKVLLSFWASWCPYCKKEMESLKLVSDQVDKEEVEIISINFKEDKDKIKRFMEENKYDFLTLLDLKGEITKLYNIKGIPTMIFIDEEGNIYNIQQKYCTSEEILNILF